MAWCCSSEVSRICCSMCSWASNCSTMSCYSGCISFTTAWAFEVSTVCFYVLAKISSSMSTTLGRCSMLMPEFCFESGVGDSAFSDRCMLPYVFLRSCATFL